MREITTVGLDLAKYAFQVHAADATGAAVLQRKLRRDEVLVFFAGLPACRVGVEACATAHFWARRISVRVLATFGDHRLGAHTISGWWSYLLVCCRLWPAFIWKPGALS